MNNTPIIPPKDATSAPKEKNAHKSHKQVKQERMISALRENLLKRKTQQKERTETSDHGAEHSNGDAI